jgi:hypothetical protein
MGAPVPDLVRRLHAFRSLGGNCEFGFVQRGGGAEPSGLLRFSYTPIDDLIHALDTDFAAFGAPGDLLIEATETRAYYCRSRSCNIWSNTAHAVGDIAPEALLEREYGRVAHLKRRILAELAEGSKILVRKASQGETEADFERLARAIRRHGPSILLRVTEAGAAWSDSAVRRVADRLLDGSVRRFAPTERAWDVDLEPWLRLCDQAYGAVHGLPVTAFDPGPAGDPVDLPSGLRRHRGRDRAGGLTDFFRWIDPAALDPDTIYTFSAWVWIPEASGAERIFAVVGGQEYLGGRDADLTVRGRWQRVWTAGRIRGTEPAPVGLGMAGSRRDRFWSRGARLHADAVPRRARPPAGAGPAVWRPSTVGQLLLPSLLGRLAQPRA